MQAQLIVIKVHARFRSTLTNVLNLWWGSVKINLYAFQWKAVAKTHLCAAYVGTNLDNTSSEPKAYVNLEYQDVLGVLFLRRKKNIRHTRALKFCLI